MSRSLPGCVARRYRVFREDQVIKSRKFKAAASEYARLHSVSSEEGVLQANDVVYADVFTDPTKHRAMRLSEAARLVLEKHGINPDTRLDLDYEYQTACDALMESAWSAR